MDTALLTEAGAASAGPMSVTVAWSSPAGGAFERPLQLPQGSTVREALAMAARSAAGQGWPQWPQAQTLGTLATGIWGRACAPERVLLAGDRLELYRPLRVDPKTARRQRFRQQGARAAGLFDRRRPPPAEVCAALSQSGNDHP